VTRLGNRCLNRPNYPDYTSGANNAVGALTECSPSSSGRATSPSRLRHVVTGAVPMPAWSRVRRPTPGARHAPSPPTAPVDTTDVPG
jgi:hypothetical protein